MEKDFKIWFELKPKLNECQLPSGFYIKAGDIWWCSLGSNIGTEIDGKNKWFDRPVLILKVFNPSHSLIVPLTHSKSGSRFHIPLRSVSFETMAVISQIRAINSKRISRKMRCNLSHADFTAVQSALMDLFISIQNETPT